MTAITKEARKNALDYINNSIDAFYACILNTSRHMSERIEEDKEFAMVGDNATMIAYFSDLMFIATNIRSVITNEALDLEQTVSSVIGMQFKDLKNDPKVIQNVISRLMKF